MTYKTGTVSSDSVNLGSNPSPPATRNADVYGTSGAKSGAEGSEQEEQTAHARRTEVGTAHTPGPWRLDGLYVWGNTGRALATVHWCSGHNDEVANARLIAAAPDMLDALKDVMSSLRVLGIDGWSDAPHLMNVVSAAIAKAEGRE